MDARPREPVFPYRWAHITLTTYGSWLHGDARGFRTRHHREHVEGDYRNPPPPGTWALREDASRSAMTQEPVVLSTAQRECVGLALLARLTRDDSLVVALAVAGRHVHILAKLPRTANWRWLVGNAKLNAWHRLRETGFALRLWARRSRTQPIDDRRHQLAIYRYIGRHANRAFTWLWLRDATDDDKLRATRYAFPPRARGRLNRARDD